MQTATAVLAEDGPDVGLPWHFGDPFGEQRALLETVGVVDRGNREAVVVPGADRLTWLHAVTSQHFDRLPEGRGTQLLVLDPHGHVEHHAQAAHVDGAVVLDTEPGSAAALLAYLDSMRFMSRVEPARADLAVVSLAGPGTDAALAAAGLPVPGRAGYDVASGGGIVARRMPWPQPDAVDLLVPRSEKDAVIAALAVRRAGTWAWDALRVAAGQARLGVDTDHRSLPHELGWIPGPDRRDAPVHLDKGCYRGQETVARIHNLGRPPRLMVLLHLDGQDDLPETGDEVLAGPRTVGRVGTVARHAELGPVALAVLKRSVAEDPQARAGLVAGGHPAAAELIAGVG